MFHSSQQSAEMDLTWTLKSNAERQKTKRKTFSTLEGILQPPINNDNIDASKKKDNAKQNKKQKRSQNMQKQCLARALSTKEKD
jgi:hypothetical protein